MTSKLQHNLPVIPNTGDILGGKEAQQHEQPNLVKFNQRLPPNTLITVCSTDLSKSSANPGLPTSCSIDSTMISSKNQIPFQTPLDKSSCMKEMLDLTIDEITTPQNEVVLKSLNNISQRKLLSNHDGNILRSSEVCNNYKSVESEASYLTIKADDSAKEVEPEKSLNCKSLSNESESLSSSTSRSSVLNREVEAKKNVSLTFCFVCNMEFGALHLLQKHIESKQFFCRVCIVEFSNHNELEIHLNSHRPFKCRTCQSVFFSKKDLFQHKQANKQCNYRIECEQCQKMFYEERCLKIHIKRYHSHSTETYSCVVCGKTFNTLEILNYHLKRIHQAYEHLECQICCVLMVGPDRLKQHVKTTHLEAAEGGINVCSICKKICSTKSLLRNHMEIHDNTVRLCEICGKSVEGKQPMRRHMAKEHSKTGFICKTCKQQFNTLNELRKHEKRHKKPLDKSVFCEICGKKLKTPNTLKIHLQIHSDDKPFKCNVCGACFKQEVTLKTHLRVHSDLGKYVCNMCGMSFRWKQTFDKHIKKCGHADQMNSFDERFSSQ